MLIPLDKVEDVDNSVKDYFDDYPHLTSNDLLEDFCAAVAQGYGWPRAYGGKYEGLNNLTPMQLASFLLANYGSRV